MSVTLQGPDLLHNDPSEYINAPPFAAQHNNDSSDSSSTVKKLIRRLEDKCSQFTFYNIPLINYCILTVFGYFLIRLTFQYHKLYTRSSLIATIITNLVLYGIADTMAQSITAFFHNRRRIERARTDSTTSISSYFTNMVNHESFPMHNTDDPESLFVDYGDPHSHSGRRQLSITDVASQNLANSNSNTKINFNFHRFVCFMFWGFVMAFVQVVWYSFLNHMYNDMPTFISVLERVLTDQLCFSPVSLICFFTYGTIVIENGELSDVKDKLYKIYIGTLACNFALWFPVQFINFLIMPKNLQVPFSSSIGVLWNCFLSLRNASGS